MKRFTKIALITSLVMAVFGIACLAGAYSMGMTTTSLIHMFKMGKFSFGPEDTHMIYDKDKEFDFSGVTKAFHSIDLDFGAGTVKICYGDVRDIGIYGKGIGSLGKMVSNGTLEIEGYRDDVEGAYGDLTIVIPKDKKLKSVKLELGASKAEIVDLKAETVEIEIGVGEAVFQNLDAQRIDAESGVGKMELQLVGKETDYNYQVECGIGSIVVGDKSYRGMGDSQLIVNDGAERVMNLESGIGKIKVHFTE